MKKRVLSVFLALILLAMPLSIPALAVLTAPDFTVSTTVNTTFTFTKEMFLYRITGGTLDYIMIKAPLPDSAVGTLMYKGVAAAADQKVPVADIDKLTFVPRTDVINVSTSIKYLPYDEAGDPAAAEGTVTVEVTDIKPVVKDLVYTTSRNQKVYGSFDATDARGRTLTYSFNPPSGDHKVAHTTNNTYPGFVFTPDVDFIGLVTFTYTATATGGATSNPATVSVYVGGRPVAYDQDISVEKNTVYTGKLKAEDPEKRKMTFDLSATDLPKNGSVSLVDAATGEFTYTPKRDFEGEDSFKFNVKVGSNPAIESNVATVKITVAKYAITPVAYDDMANHWGATSAGSLAALGIIKGETISFSTTGTATGATEERTFFRPDDNLTRGEFIMWMVSAMRIKPDASAVTVFYDTVPYWLVGPTNAAYHANIVQGTLVNGRRLLKAGDNLTRLEAVVMIDRAMELSSNDDTPAFVDWATVPDWGRQAVRNLAGYEILKGTDAGFLHPHDMLTRAEAAELLFKTYKEIVLEKR